jgi:hypothetical protein
MLRQGFAGKVLRREKVKGKAFSRISSNLMIPVKLDTEERACHFPLYPLRCLYAETASAEPSCIISGR